MSASHRLLLARDPVCVAVSTAIGLVEGIPLDPLAGPELESLVADLRRCRMPYTCPHGRPTLIEMSLKELEKKFGRVQ